MVTKKKAETSGSARPQPVKITHPSLKGQVGYALPSSLPVWLDRGWTVVDDGSSSTTAATANANEETAR